jgi:hypothetical protein
MNPTAATLDTEFAIGNLKRWDKRAVGGYEKICSASVYDIELAGVPVDVFAIDEMLEQLVSAMGQMGLREGHETAPKLVASHLRTDGIGWIERKLLAGEGDERAMKRTKRLFETIVENILPLFEELVNRGCLTRISSSTA